MQETQEMRAQSLDQEESLEEGMATHPNIPAWKIPLTGNPGWLKPMGLQRARHDWATEHPHMLLLLL